MSRTTSKLDETVKDNEPPLGLRFSSMSEINKRWTRSLTYVGHNKLEVPSLYTTYYKNVTTLYFSLFQSCFKFVPNRTLYIILNMYIYIYIYIDKITKPMYLKPRIVIN